MTQPAISIIIPVYNRLETLRLCLDSISRLDYDASGFEVIVVDDGSDSSPDEIVSAFSGTIPVTLIRQPNAGPAAARNAGARLARGRYLAFLDHDCQPEPEWLERLHNRLESNHGAAVGGHTEDGAAENAYSAASFSITEAVYRWKNRDPLRARFCNTTNLAVPADVFQSVGGFDEGFRTAEDREFCARWLSSGQQLIYAPEVRVWHFERLTFSALWRRHFEYGRGAYRFWKSAPLGREDREGLEPLRFYLEILLSPLRKQRDIRSLRIAFLIAISQLASLLGYCSERRRGTTTRAEPTTTRQPGVD